MSLWLWAACLLLPAAYLQLLAHELSHLLVAKSTGAEIVTFRPYPSQVDGKWWFGYVQWRGGTVTRFASLSPIIAAFVMGGVGGVLTLGVWTPLMVMPFCAFVDILWWFRGYFGVFSKDPTKLDGWKFRYFGQPQAKTP